MITTLKPMRMIVSLLGLTLLISSFAACAPRTLSLPVVEYADGTPIDYEIEMTHKDETGKIITEHVSR